MKNSNWLVLIYFIVFSCNDDFVLTEDWKDVPVIYGFLNRADTTAQFIRVEKLFVDEDKPAIEMALIPDSLYYPNAKVTLYNITRKKEYTLTKVDANLEGFPRKPGPFATAPNFMYKIKSSDIQWAGGDSIELRVDRGDSKALVYSKIQLVKDVEFSSPRPDNREVKFSPTLSQSFIWTKLQNGTLYDFEILVKVQEINSVTGDVQIKSIPWKLQKGDLRTNVNVAGIGFYNLLKENLIIDQKISRQIHSLELTVRAGGPEIFDFNSVINANTGITSSQEIPRYTNISEGFGLFSSIHTFTRLMNIDIETRNFLKTLEETRQLNF